jgi:hypothetical protein
MDKNGNEIDKRSFRLGVIYCFAEMVSVGVKKLALSPPLTPEEHEAICEGSEKIVADFKVNSFLDKSFLVTDLFTEELTEGKWVILYYNKDDVLEIYNALKKKKQELLEAGMYGGDDRTEIAREFGKLLTYPEKQINEMLNKGPSGLPSIG